MSTTAQILANRANAAVSAQAARRGAQRSPNSADLAAPCESGCARLTEEYGSSTLQDKAASSRNAAKHGLSSACRVLAHEDQQEFDQVLEDLRAYHGPRDIHQRLLVDQLAKSQWLLARAQRLQAVAYDLLAGVEDENDAHVAIVNSMRASNPDVIGRLERYAASAERSFYQAYRELTKLNEAIMEKAIQARLSEYRAPQPRPIQNEPDLTAAPATSRLELTTDNRQLTTAGLAADH